MAKTTAFEYQRGLTLVSQSVGLLTRHWPEGEIPPEIKNDLLRVKELLALVTRRAAEYFAKQKGGAS